MPTWSPETETRPEDPAGFVLPSTQSQLIPGFLSDGSTQSIPTCQPALRRRPSCCSPVPAWRPPELFLDRLGVVPRSPCFLLAQYPGLLACLGDGWHTIAAGFAAGPRAAAPRHKVIELGRLYLCHLHFQFLTCQHFPPLFSENNNKRLAFLVCS